MDLFSTKRPRHFKLLVVSVSVVVLIALSCGLCASFTKHRCMTTIASLLLLIEDTTNVHQNNSKKDSTSQTTDLFTNHTFKNSYGNCAANIRTRTCGTFIAANTGTKTNDRITMLAYSISLLTIRKSMIILKGEVYTLRLLSKNSGLMASQPWQNLISTRQLIRPLTASRKLRANNHGTNTYVPTNTVVPSGSYPLT